jgi:Fe-S-cluster-containing hydrogenase component 2
MDYEQTGVLSLEDLQDQIPPEKRMRKGKVAMLECVQKIPCDACALACPKKAIKMRDILEVPKVNFKLCTGCGMCVRICPGLAAFLLDLSEGIGRITIPYEFLPIPKVGELVEGLDRKGKRVTLALVTSVQVHKDKTALVTIEVDPTMIMIVRNIRVFKK